MRRALKTSGPPPRQSYVATWTRSQVYLIHATTFDEACERALEDRHLYTPRTVEKLTVRQLQPLQEPARSADRVHKGESP